MVHFAIRTSPFALWRSDFELRILKWGIANVECRMSKYRIGSVIVVVVVFCAALTALHVSVEAALPGARFGLHLGWRLMAPLIRYHLNLEP